MHWIILLGIVTGMRTMTGIALLCWWCWLGWLPVEHTWAAWAASLAAVIVFTLCALGEYLVDILPQTPSRKTLGPLLARLIVGGLCGAVAVTAQTEPPAGGVILGVIGAVIGAYGGYWLRMRLAAWFGRDLPAGLLESAICLAIALYDVHCIHLGVVRDAALELIRISLG